MIRILCLIKGTFIILYRISFLTLQTQETNVYLSLKQGRKRPEGRSKKGKKIEKERKGERERDREKKEI